MDKLIQALAADVDITLIRENLKLSPHERMVKFDRFIRSVVELRQQGEAHRRKLESSAETGDTKMPSQL